MQRDYEHQIVHRGILQVNKNNDKNIYGHNIIKNVTVIRKLEIGTKLRM